MCVRVFISCYRPRDALGYRLSALMTSHLCGSQLTPRSLTTSTPLRPLFTTFHWMKSNIHLTERRHWSHKGLQMKEEWSCLFCMCVCVCVLRGGGGGVGGHSPADDRRPPHTHRPHLMKCSGGLRRIIRVKIKTRGTHTSHMGLGSRRLHRLSLRTAMCYRVCVCVCLFMFMCSYVFVCACVCVRA